MPSGDGLRTVEITKRKTALRVLGEISVAKPILSIKIMVITFIFIEAAKLFGGLFSIVGASGMLADEKSGEDADPGAGAVC